VQVKRIHEYKRQLLNILDTIALYNEMRAEPGRTWAPRVKVFAGKAAASYHQAKLIIKLANDVARIVNRDPTVRGLLKVVFLPNYNVHLGEVIIPAADLSEQISTAGMEASGTGNMKFMMNGALTIGTLDGANVEIREEAGSENFFLFGLTAPEVERVRREGYRPARHAEENAELREALDLLASGRLTGGDPEVLRPVVESLLTSDPFLVLADYAAYLAVQARVSEAWREEGPWTRMSILNTARSGKFSSDRAIREYCDETWHVPAVRIALD
jgi:starch phosphorylase